MSRTFKRLFADHPREVGETYVQHLGHAMGFAGKLARLSALAALHAVVPGVHKTTVSDEVKRMARDMGGRADEALECRMREAGTWDPGL